MSPLRGWPRLCWYFATAAAVMSQIKRSEFNLYIQSNGGQVEPLVQELEARARR